MSTTIRYVAEPAHVREVSLLGTADLAFWSERLQREGILPSSRAGRAQILIVAAEMKFWGIRFTEVSFSVLATVPEDTTRNAALLVHAFNSCRLFAFCERQLFATPYSHADCRVSASACPSIQVRVGCDVIFRASMPPAPPAREPSHSGDDEWTGTIFLPVNQRNKSGERRLFFGKMSGHARVYSFLQTIDSVFISPSAESEILHALLDSRFTAEEWKVRADATHGKSKTYRRSDIIGEQSYRPAVDAPAARF